MLAVVAAGLVALLRGRRRLALWLLCPATLALLALGLLPLGQWLMLPLENRFPALEQPPDRVDGVIVLGGAVDLRSPRAAGWSSSVRMRSAISR